MSEIEKKEECASSIFLDEKKLGIIARNIRKIILVFIKFIFSLILTVYINNKPIKNKIRLIYASSAATYGNGDKGYIDNQNLAYLKSLKPLNIYAWSKNEVDKRNLFAKNILNISPPQWISLKFFNVYGPNESHKENMISIILKTFQ